MPKKLTQKEFIARAKAVHGDKYDYSKVEYKNANSKVFIICPKHGEFTNIAVTHLNGSGCPKCVIEKKRKLVSGIGINDVECSTNEPYYDVWAAMLKRCYDPKAQVKNPTYRGCSVCEEWHTLSNFKKWYEENYIEGYDIDKDILVKDNKVYSSETCCFIPKAINRAISYKRAHKYYCGVRYVSPNHYRVILNIGGRIECISGFKTPESAFVKYKELKEKHIKEIATSHYERGEITKRVYGALMRYEIPDSLTPQK